MIDLDSAIESIKIKCYYIAMFTISLRSSMLSKAFMNLMFSSSSSALIKLAYRLSFFSALFL